MTTSNRTPIVIAVIGLAIEAVVLVLLSTKRIHMTVATPLIIMGMLMAFVPLFVVARRSRKR
ncbi:MAG TPA: hypothetical protein VNI54_13080 [Thermoanaerobaculia bacterium]|nr:hypothetical protein [Thermoanaerobaculia bacterium]